MSSATNAFPEDDNHKHHTTVKTYYDSDDANKFYSLWGGENIHIGKYPNKNIEDIAIDEIKQASVDSDDHFLSEIPNLKTTKRVADLGAGIGGTARSIIKYRKKNTENDIPIVDCYDMSSKLNETNEKLCKEQQLEKWVNVYEKSYLHTGVEDSSYDVLTSIDAMLHCPDHEALFKECARILQKGGYFVFKDILQSSNAKEENLKGIKERLHLTEMGSVELYRKLGEKFGMKMENVENLEHDMRTHYSVVRHQLLTKSKELGISEDYTTNVGNGLKLWVDGIDSGDITYGLFVFKKE